MTGPELRAVVMIFICDLALACVKYIHHLCNLYVKFLQKNLVPLRGEN